MGSGSKGRGGVGHTYTPPVRPVSLFSGTDPGVGDHPFPSTFRPPTRPPTRSVHRLGPGPSAPETPPPTSYRVLTSAELSSHPRRGRGRGTAPGVPSRSESNPLFNFPSKTPSPPRSWTSHVLFPRPTPSSPSPHVPEHNPTDTSPTPPVSVKDPKDP